MTALVVAGDADVGDGFLSHRSNVTAMDLTPLAHLTKVDSSCLGSCTGLTALDLTPLAQLTSVGDGFLSG